MLLPTADRILVRRQAPETVSRGGLHIPAQAQETAQLATVVAVGPGRVTDNGIRIAPTVEVGMTVLLGKWVGEKVGPGVVIDVHSTAERVDAEHILIREADVLAVVTP